MTLNPDPRIAVVDAVCDVEETRRPFGRRWRQEEVVLNAEHLAALQAGKLLSEGTTIISARGTVGKCAMVGVSMAMNQSCDGVRGKDGRGDSFTYFALRNLVFELQHRTHGSVFDTITRDTFKGVQIVIVPVEVTSEFDRQVAPILKQIHANLHESRTLAAIRDALLPKLLSGEVRVKDAERFVEARL